MSPKAARILELARKGLSSAIIAQRLGTSPGRVTQIANAVGFYFPRQAQPSRPSCAGETAPTLRGGVRSSLNSAPASQGAGVLLAEGKP